jgi:hypothetical protein
MSAVAPSPTAGALLSLHANDDVLSAVHDRTATVAAPGVLANDDAAIGRTAVLNAGPSNGTLTLNANGGYTYRPRPAFVGTDQFVYHEAILSLLLNSNPATVRITVTNAAPVARDDSYTAETGVTLSVAAPGVLANDTDADGDQLSASLVDGGGNGSLSLSSNGGFTFKSGGSFVGLRTFTYRVSDGVVASGIATVSIDVRSSSATPTPTPTPTPQPTPTPTPVPTPTLPPIPTPVPIPTLVPLPSLIPIPTLVPIPTPAPSVLPGPSGSPTPTPSGSPGGSSDPTSTAATSDAPTGAGSIGGDPPTQPGGLGGGLGREGGFVVGRGDLGPIDGLGDIGIVGIGGLVMWAVPALVLTVPGLLLLVAVLAQAAGALFWVPVARRWLGGFGIRRRRETDRSSA